MLSLMILLPLRDWRSELEARPEVYSRIYSWAARRLRGTRDHSENFVFHSVPCPR